MSAPNDDRDIVLVVDDSPESLHLLTDALEESGFTALVARSGPSALALLQRVIPDVILMDAVMPDMDGFETCRRIKDDQTLAHIPIIFMTGLTETEHVVVGFQAGGIDYVTKPVKPPELVARIQTHIASARLAHSARLALDMSGIALLAVDGAGAILWSTPKALAKLREARNLDEDDIDAALTTMREQLAAVVVQRTSGLLRPGAAGELRVSYLGEARAGEFLVGLSDSQGPRDEEALRAGLRLTEREAEVLLWITQGKSNRDIAAILQCSPRTVNKHLEQIYSKLGVENRTSAAMAAVRVLADR